MKSSTKMAFLAVVLLQLLVLGGMVVRQQQLLATGTKVLLECEPRDPRSLFQGDYVILNYKISTLGTWWNWAQLNPRNETFRKNQTVYVAIEKSTTSQFWNAVALSADRAVLSKYAVVIRGKVRDFNNYSLQGEHHVITEYFISDLNAFAIKLREGQDPLSRYLFEHLTPATREQLIKYNYKPNNENYQIDYDLRKLVCTELNQLTHQTSLYHADWFAGIALSLKIQTLLEQKPTGGDILAIVNRCLLEEFYTKEVAHTFDWLDSREMLSIRYGVEQYFVPQGQGIAIEQTMNKVSVEVSVDQAGKSAINKLFIEGKEVKFQ